MTFPVLLGPFHNAKYTRTKTTAKQSANDNFIPPIPSKPDERCISSTLYLKQRSSSHEWYPELQTAPSANVKLLQF